MKNIYTGIALLASIFSTAIGTSYYDTHHSKPCACASVQRQKPRQKIRYVDRPVTLREADEAQKKLEKDMTKLMSLAANTISEKIQNTPNV